MARRASGPGHDGPVTDAVCERCGRPVEAHDRHVRFLLPDPVLDTTAQVDAPGTWMSHETANESVLLQVPDLGAFVRCLLPVKLTGGYTVTFGVWLGVHPDDLQRAFRVWWEPDYRDLVLRGHLANTLPVWGLLATPAVAHVVDDDTTPVIDESPDPTFARLLAEEHPHEELLSSLPA